MLTGNIHSGRHVWDRDLMALKSGWMALPNRQFLCAEPGPDGSLLAFSGWNDTWFRTAAGKVHVPEIPRLSDAKFLDAHRILASDFATGDLLICDVSSGKIIERMKGHSRGVPIVGLLADSRAFSCGLDGTIRIWNLTERRCEHTVTGQPNTCEEAVLPDGRQFLTGNGDGSVRLWTLGSNPEDEPHFDALIRGPGAVFGLAITADGERFAAGYSRGEVVVYDLGERREVTRFQTHAVSELTFSLDGRRLFVGGLSSALLRVYDTATWTELIALQGHTARIAEVVFAADGTTLITTDDAGFVRLRRGC
jgi:WD40 repeat protein